MSDDRLRELERRFQVSGTLEDHEALLRERVRAGELDAWRVDLWRHLALPSARDQTLYLWIDELYSEHGTANLIRALVPVAWLALRATPGSPRAQQLEPALHVAEQWIVCDCFPAPPTRYRAGYTTERLCEACQARAAHVAPAGWAQPTPPPPLDAVVLAPCDWMRHGWDDWASEFDVGWLEPCEALELTREQIQAAIAAELIPWALAERDPVRERVDARGD